jgi:uncharacterized protein YjdB
MHVLHVVRRTRVGSPRAMERSSLALDRRACRAAIFGAVLSVAALAGCKESADPEKATAITGMNAVDSVRLGKTFTFVVELRGASGAKLTGRRVTWTSLNPTIAAVDANGVVTGAAIGNTTITAQVDGVTATTQMSVQPAVTRVLLVPPTNTVAIGSQKTITVALNDKDGQTVGGRTVAFSSSNASIATVNAAGVVVGVTVGAVTITGTSVLDEVSGTAAVTVVPVAVSSIAITPAGSQTVFQGLTLQLSATTRDNTGAILTGRPVNWTTSNSAIASVSLNGLVTGASLGNAQITAESEGVTSSVQISVARRPVATIALAPASVKQGTAVQMSLDLRDANGNALTTTGRTVTWDSSNKVVATVSDGVVSGLSPGTTTITVTVDDKPASALVTVTP